MLQAAEAHIAKLEQVVVLQDRQVLDGQSVEAALRVIISEKDALIAQQHRQITVGEKAVKKSWIRRAVSGAVSMIPALAAGLVIGAVAR